MSDTWDVVVVGGGGAGLAAAVSAAENGRRVIVFESQGALGGSTMESAGMITAAGTSVQAALGVADSPREHFRHYMDLNQWKLKPGLVRRFCEQAGPTFEWMLGMGLQVPTRLSHNAHSPGLVRAGVEDIWRGHVPEDQGYALVQVLERRARELGVDIILHAPVENLRTQEGAVVGVTVDGEPVDADGVVIASGGFAANRDLVRRHYPAGLVAHDSGFVAAAPGALGDHLRFAHDAGAATTGDGWGLLLITASFQRYHHWRAGFPPVSRLYVSPAGTRFMDEDASYAVAEGLFAQIGGYAWAIFDSRALHGLPPGGADWCERGVQQAVDRGEAYLAPTLDELAGKIGVAAALLTATVDGWNRTIPHGEDPVFLRHESLTAKGIDPASVDPIEAPPFYAVRMIPGELVCTHAGIEIDGDGRALALDGAPVPGLFAAGEAGAGILGERYIGGGNSIANALTMGRLAGAAAAGRR
ncbi:FAD-dependent oxidoreductase [Dactylosporangium sp. CA-233914]|uniref:FAD-dependent oxidoreductase n=1 Tax=Dactylosporangium sp. CA-233914 TaxID=3239934 RepID=UPI003D8ACD43